jgi:uncharacterized membrane protein
MLKQSADFLDAPDVNQLRLPARLSRARKVNVRARLQMEKVGSAYL